MTEKDQNMPTTTANQLVCATGTVKEQRKLLQDDSEAQDARRRSFTCWFCRDFESGGDMSRLRLRLANLR